MSSLKRIMTVLICAGLLPTAYAVPENAEAQGVYFNIKEKTWVNSETAKVTTAINATLNNTNMSQLYQKTQTVFNKLYGQDNWHLVRFQRSQTQSGLEQIKARAQGRLDQDQLGQIRQQAKKLSEPGFQLEIASIDYQPSLEEREAALKQLRSRIYERTQDEISALEKIYPQQRFTIGFIQFGDQAHYASRAKAANQVVAFEAEGRAKKQPNLAVGTKLILNAAVAIKPVDDDD